MSKKESSGRFLVIIQTLGRSIMLPIALLPGAGLLLAFGHSNVLGWPIMEQAGGIVFANLPILFAVGIAIGFSRNDGAAGLAAIVSFLVVNVTMSNLLGLNLKDYVEGNLDGARYALVLGIPSLQTGVFGGMLSGALAAMIFNKFKDTQLPPFLGFFNGKRLVLIITAFASFLLGLVLPTLWGPVQSGLDALSSIAYNENNLALSALFFGIIERALIPFGLHHVFYSPFWFQFGEYTSALTGEFVRGDQPIFFSKLADGVSFGNTGIFMTGKFPFMMFGLPAAALAMYHQARPERRKLAGGLLFSAALTAFLTGITEPIEFAFLFIAPFLYAIHVLIAGVSFMLMAILNVRIGMTFSGGLIDFILFGIIPGNEFTHWTTVIPVGLVLAVVYYVLFTLAIRYFDLQTPGRESTEEGPKDLKITSEKAISVLKALGGAENIVTIDACITRLRLELNDPERMDEVELKKLGASGVMRVGGGGVQAIFGTASEVLKDEIARLLQHH